MLIVLYFLLVINFWFLEMLTFLVLLQAKFHFFFNEILNLSLLHLFRLYWGWLFRELSHRHLRRPVRRRMQVPKRSMVQFCWWIMSLYARAQGNVLRKTVRGRNLKFEIFFFILLFDFLFKYSISYNKILICSHFYT